MFVAALLDAFPGLAPRVLADARAVLPEGVGEPFLRVGLSGGLAVRRFGLEGATDARHVHSHADDHSHSHTHSAHPSLALLAGLDPATQTSPAVLVEALGPRVEPVDEGARGSGEPAHHYSHSHGAGTYRDMVARIGVARLSAGTAGHALAILALIAQAESALHRVPLDEVHFHEIADWDSLLDVVAAIPECRAQRQLTRMHDRGPGRSTLLSVEMPNDPTVEALR
ncbi:MAG: DUF111 family protein, partial [Starkeya sp.]|nr:DUF111 family protein [Starkeya sp.]